MPRLLARIDEGNIWPMHIQKQEELIFSYKRF